MAHRCLAGDADAIREFVEHFERRVFVLCLRMLGHRQDAEDTAQEALHRAVRYLHNWDPTQPITPWVMKIAANRCRTALARRAKMPIPVENAGVSLSSNVPVEVGLADDMQRALETLPPHVRRCFEMFYLRQQSCIEIAESLAIPEGTVKTWLHRGRKQLAEFLRQQGHAPGDG
ncbi:MAG: sigma-70 family RNA polymerase sigma factor [Planctomycetaceae bacterium]|nr:sigma-70 family RNA polymerase sigma factor [Planctomycetaceae bacterium]